MAQVDQGHQDWQNTSPHDSIGLIADRTTNYNGTQAFGPFNVAGFTGIAGLLQVNAGGLVRWRFTFSGDRAGLQNMGSREVYVDSAGPGIPPTLSMQALGPWLAITATPNGAIGWVSSAYVAAVNRVTMGVLAPQTGLLMQSNAAAIGAGATLTVVANEYWAGPALLHTYCQAQPLTIILEAETAAGVWSLVYADLLPANTPRTPTVILPPYPCRLRLTNTGAGAGTAQYALTAPLTGSS